MNKILISILICGVLALFSVGIFLHISHGKLNVNTYKPLESLPRDYSIQLAEENGDIVELNNGECINKELMDNFIEDSKSKEECMVRITKITIEGDLIIWDLRKSQKGVELTIDNTRDKFAGGGCLMRYSIYNIYKKNEKGFLVYYGNSVKDVEIPLLFVNEKS